VLADEPTANLDSQTGAAIIELMRHMQREHDVSVVICSHDPQVIAAADDTVVIRDGRIESVRRAGGEGMGRHVPGPAAQPLTPVAGAGV
jgi:putative ABC transport system ATP-binding protein